VRVHFLGVRGSTPAPGIDFVRYGGHTSCVAISGDTASAPSLILDAGTGIRRATPLCDGAGFSGTILLGHLHWDHVHGLPFFNAGDRDNARVDLFMPAQPDGASALDVLSRAMSPPHFPVRPDELRGRWTFNSLDEGTHTFEGFSVTAAEIPHKGGRTFGYRVSDGRSSLAYLSDHCPSDLGPGPEGWGKYHENALALAEGVDALIHDAQLMAEEHADQASFGHSAAEYAIELGRRAAARRVLLYHHRPSRTDDQLDAIATRFAHDERVAIAHESMVLEL